MESDRDRDSLYGGINSEPATLITTEELIITNRERKLSTTSSQIHLDHVGDLVAEAMLDSEFVGGSGVSRQNSSKKRQQLGQQGLCQPVMIPTPIATAPLKPQPMYDLHFAPDFGDVFQFQCKDDDDFSYSKNNNYEEDSSTPLPPMTNNNMFDMAMPIMETSNGGPIDLHGSDEDEEEFCILENDPGVGIIVRN
jgi:hypothetical protein